jgi:hypothetical protein
MKRPAKGGRNYATSSVHDCHMLCIRDLFVANTIAFAQGWGRFLRMWLVRVCLVKLLLRFDASLGHAPMLMLRSQNFEYSQLVCFRKNPVEYI